MEILKELQSLSGENTEVYGYKNCKIRNSALVHGIELYTIGIQKFLGNSLISRIEKNADKIHSLEDLRKVLVPDTASGQGEWVDLAGLIAPRSEVTRLLDELEKDHDYLTAGGVFPERLLDQLIKRLRKDNEEIMSMIDENYQQVLKNGYAELRIPLSLHGITEDVCLSDESLQEQADFWNADAWWEPEDVADVALFLASDLSSYVTGQVIQIDGGMNT